MENARKSYEKVVSDTLTKRFLLNREHKPDFKCAQEQHRLNMEEKELLLLQEYFVVKTLEN